MNMEYFIRLLLRNKWKLILFPLALAATVYFLTRNESKTFHSKTIIYTGITSGLTIETFDRSRVDYFAATNAFDNLINIIHSRETIEETALTLFAHHLFLTKHRPEALQKKNFDAFQKMVPENIRQVSQSADTALVIQRLLEIKNSNDTNFIYKLLQYSHPHYSIKAIKKIQVKRINSSDLIEISFQSNDPGICKSTLEILTTVFLRKHHELRVNQSDEVVRYFEKQLDLAAEKLRKAENQLLLFNKKNQIINYYEQTKYIAASKEQIEQQYNNQRMKLASAQAAVSLVESKLSHESQLKLHNQSILDKREMLSNLNYRIANIETFGTNEPQETTLLQKLVTQAEITKQALSDNIRSIYENMQSKEGMEIKSLLDSWLNNVILFEETNAGLIVLEKFKNDFFQNYLVFAPLGAEMKRIERGINVTEREYLQILHSLNLAKLKQQNLELSSSIKVVDPPYFPLSPEKSKRKVLIAAAFVAGGIFLLSFLLLKDYFDASLKNPVKAAKITGYPVLGLIPSISFKKESDFQKKILQKTGAFMSQNILLMMHQKEQVKPFKVMIGSVFENEGKSTCLDVIEQNLIERGFTKNASAGNINIRSFNDPDSSISVEFHEIKAFNLAEMPFNEIRQAGMHLIVADANRYWSKSDKKLLDVYANLAESPILFILSRSAYEFLDHFIGSVPKKRSKFRKTIKNILHLQFNTISYYQQ